MKKSILTCAVATLLSFNTQANNEPGAFRTESGFVVTPLLDLGLKQDDNIYSRSNNETSSTILTVDPSVNFLLDDGVNSYSIDAGVLSGFYTEDSTDNYVDGFLGFSGHFEPSSKSRFDLNADAIWTTEPRGTGLTEGIGSEIDKPLRYSEQYLEGIYEYGARSAFGRVAVRGQYYNKEYLNFKEQTQYRNLDRLLFGGKFVYNTQAGSDAFVELTHEDISYDITAPNELARDSKDVRALVGFEWKATALTSGSAKLGYQKKDFDDTGRDNFTGLSWEAGITWSPLTYSSFDLSTSQAAVDPLTEGDYIEETTFDLGWNHNWNERLSSRLGVSYLLEDYVGVAREDDTTTLVAEINYQLLRWVGITGYVNITDKDSTREGLFFDKNVVGLNFSLSM